MRHINKNNKKKFNKIYIEITNICNLHCSFCPDSKGKKEFMSTTNFERIINQVVPYTDLIALHVKGEPLMHPKLNELLTICDNYNIFVNLTTNGTLLLDTVDTLISHKCIRQLNISVHSLNENNDLSFFNNYFSKLYICIDKIHLNSNIIVSLRLWNITNIKENDKNYNILTSLSNNFNIPDLITKAQENKFVELAPRVFLNQDTIFKWPDLDSLTNCSKLKPICGTCYGARNQLAILVNGTVVPCCIDQNGDISLGNIFDTNLTDIINSDKSNKLATEFRQNIISNPLCISCGFRTKFDTKFNK